MKFQELCLQYGENNLSREQLIQYIKLTEALHELDLTISDTKVELSEEHRKFTDKCLTTEYQNLKIKYDLLYSKWEQFSRCLNMGPEKFISMLDDLKEKLKSKGNEIAHLREQLKTSELDAKRYKNDGIQDRVKLQELETEIKKHQELLAKITFDYRVDLSDYMSEFWELFPTQKIDLSSYIKSKKELDELIEKRLSIFEEPTLKVIGNGIDGYHNIYVKFLDKLLFVDNVKNNLSSLKDSLVLVEFPTTYAIKNIKNGNYLYTIDKSTKCVEKLTHIEFVRLGSSDTDCCKCPYSCRDCKNRCTKIYFTIGAERILVDTVPFEVDYWHYNICEDSTKTRYIIARKDPMQKDLHNYSIDKETLKVKVID